MGSKGRGGYKAPPKREPTEAARARKAMKTMQRTREKSTGRR